MTFDLGCDWLGQFRCSIERFPDVGFVFGCEQMNHVVWFIRFAGFGVFEESEAKVSQFLWRGLGYDFKEAVVNLSVGNRSLTFEKAADVLSLLDGK